MNSTPEPPSERIEAFWAWFGSAAKDLQEMLDRSDSRRLAETIGPRLEAASDCVGWEVGPGRSKTWAFAITLNGSLENLPLAERFVAAAPDMPDWELHVGRPPKTWSGKFQLRNAQGQQVTICCSEWTYVLTAFDDGVFFDIELYAEDLPPMDDVAKEQTARFVVQSMLGERRMLERVDRVGFLESPTGDWSENATPIDVLGDHLDFLADQA